MLPPPPPDLEGQELNIEYLNIVAAAQRDQSSRGAIDLISFVSQFTQIPPFDTMAMKIKIPEAIEEIAAGMDVPQKLLTSLQEMREAIEAMQKQQEEAAKMQQMQEMANMAAQAGGITGAGGNPVSQNLAEDAQNVAG